MKRAGTILAVVAWSAFVLIFVVVLLPGARGPMFSDDVPGWIAVVNWLLWKWPALVIGGLGYLSIVLIVFALRDRSGASEQVDSRGKS